MGQIIGYARVSSTGQTLEVQEQMLQEAGCERIYKEKVSGARSDRPQLLALLDYAREGDTVIVTKLDRIARSMRDLTRIMEKLENKKVWFRVLNMGIDTATAQGRLMVNILGSIAEFERELILERQAEGIERAKKMGKFKGRVPTARAKTNQVVELIEQGHTRAAVAARLGIGESSVYRILRGRIVDKTSEVTVAPGISLR